MTEQTPTPSTASESVLGSRSEHSSGAATAPPLPLVRHHREGGDERRQGDVLLLFRVCGAWNTAPETGPDLYAQERSALLVVADWLDEQQRDYAGHSFSRAACLIREELER